MFVGGSVGLRDWLWVAGRLVVGEKTYRAWRPDQVGQASGPPILS